MGFEKSQSYNSNYALQVQLTTNNSFSFFPIRFLVLLSVTDPFTDIEEDEDEWTGTNFF